MNQEEYIMLRGLELRCRIGVTEAERAKFQRILADVRLWPEGGLKGLGDDLSNTVDYYELSRQIVRMAKTGERRLIETLAEDICRLVLENPRVAKTSVRIRKFILSNTEYVAVQAEMGR